MARYEFGRSLDDPDTLVIQGREYTMMPIGVRVMRSVLTKRRALVADSPRPMSNARPKRATRCCR